jgi:hypothetical protein
LSLTSTCFDFLTRGIVPALNIDVVFVEGVFRKIRILDPANQHALSRMDVTVHALGAFFARRDRIDGETSAMVAIAADEDIGFGGLISQRIGFEPATVTTAWCPFEEVAPLEGLADRG